MTAITDASNRIKARSRLILYVDESNYSHIGKATALKKVWDSF